MPNWTHMAALVAEIPDLPGAACAGRWELFNATIGARPVDGVPTTTELEYARNEALRLCHGCKALGSCRSYLTGLPPSQRPPGVIAGQVISTSGKTLKAQKTRAREPISRGRRSARTHNTDEADQ